MSKNIKFVQGNEACAEAALYAGLDFFAGYPITPSSEILETLAYRLPQIGGKFIQMEDEIASLCAIIGASLTGRKAMTATSGPGFSLMQEALGYAVMAEIPCVIVNVQRGGPSTGLPTHGSQGDVCQARWGTHGDHSIIALTASNQQDIFSITVEAFNLAEIFRTPVILLFDEVTAHMREPLVIPQPGEIPLVERLRTSVKEGVDYHPYLPREDGRLPMSDFGGVHRYNVTGLIHDMWGFPSSEPGVAHGLLHHLVDKLENRAHQLARYKEYYIEDSARSPGQCASSMPSSCWCLTDLQPVPPAMLWRTEDYMVSVSGCWSCRHSGLFRIRLYGKNVPKPNRLSWWSRIWGRYFMRSSLRWMNQAGYFWPIVLMAYS